MRRARNEAATGTFEQQETLLFSYCPQSDKITVDNHEKQE